MTEQNTISFDPIANNVVRGLNRPKPLIFWTDMAGSALVAWAAFAFAASQTSLDGIGFVALLVSGIFFYRGLCFIHEIAHVRPESLPGFELAWNLLLGVPLLLPSIVYVGVHGDHHKLSTYGTDQDPEYLPFAKNNLMVITFSLHTVLIPLFLLFRFLVITPVGLLVPKFHRWLAVHATALCMNFNYKRNVSPALEQQIRIWEMVILAAWTASIALAFSGVLPWRVFVMWYGINASIALVNAIRTLGAHRYESDGAQMGRREQLIDSIDTPGGIWTELWAPVGLRYHALHHYFPGVPYHNLPEAYRKLCAALPSEAPFRQTTSPSLQESLGTLYANGQRARRRKSPATL